VFSFVRVILFLFLQQLILSHNFKPNSSLYLSTNNWKKEGKKKEKKSTSSLHIAKKKKKKNPNNKKKEKNICFGP
jgi:hypothetical protein